jgi:arginyl-tRNA synthetase
MIREDIQGALSRAIEAVGIALPASIPLEHPDELAHGDYASSVALVLAKEAGTNPRELALRLVEEIEKQKPAAVENVGVAGPGFINFQLSRSYFAQSIQSILDANEKWGRLDLWTGKKTIIEYTDPNPFKEFHIGHLLPNVAGESLSRILEFTGTEVKRANYQGDVGIHVACAIWGLLQGGGDIKDASQLGSAYAHGASAYKKEDEKAKQEIIEINKKIYERSDEKINELYDRGRQISLDRFEELYAILGTKFDYYFFESETGPIGKEIVENGLSQGIFEKSDSAVVYRGEKHGLHTRVFINSEGLPTYEAKELGLAKRKAEIYPYDHSFVVTANEITEYFKVLLAAMRELFPHLAEKTEHITHGLMKLTTGKMSSRTGNIVTGESLIEGMLALARERMQDREFSDDEREDIAKQVAVAAIKFQILRVSLGRDIVYDPERALSLEGDSGPYLQYAHTRAVSVLEKGGAEGVSPSTSTPTNEAVVIERLLYRFPEVVERAFHERQPHHIVTYLLDLAGAFNVWYGQVKIVDGTPEAPYKLAVTDAFRTTMQNGLYLLGIEAPERM